MLTYAFKSLNAQSYKSIETENFINTGDLFAQILIIGIKHQLKQGLNKDYVSENEELSTLRGRIDINSSLKDLTMLRNKLVCSYDEFSVNSYFNRIIKTCALLLLKADIDVHRRKELRNLMIYFNEVTTLDVHNINWKIAYNRNNQNYRLLIGICYLFVKGLLQSKRTGDIKVMDFLDEQRTCRLYEKFILEYYRKEHPELKANASQIKWQLDDDNCELLPIMQTDITLSDTNGNVLIIDAKYYTRTTVTKFGKRTLHTGNIYQIFTYVKNKETELLGTEHKVSGMLLYAKTEEEITPNVYYMMSGNKISAKTLDLSVPFDEIKAQLDNIAKSYFEKI
jgi:5-methylcytosine-specific restriction enzyme subunit McrC